MIQSYMYSPTSPSYSPSYRPSMAFASSGKSDSMFHVKLHGPWIGGLLVLLFAVFSTRVASDPMFAQKHYQNMPQLVQFYQTTLGKVVIALLYLAAFGLFTGSYKVWIARGKKLL